MKNSVSRSILCLFLIFVLLFCLFISPASAAETYNFLFNDTYWKLSQSTPILIRQDFVCMPLDRLLAQFNMTYTYDETIQNLTLFRYNSYFSFNLSTFTCSVDGKPPVPAPAFYENGVFYVPIDFLAEQFGYIFTRLNNGVYRLVTQPIKYSDAQYNWIFSVTPPSFDQKANPVFYPLFENSPNRYTANILDVCKNSGTKAVFFLTESGIRSRPDLVRRILTEGHTIGLQPSRATAGSVESANDLLQKYTKRRAHLLLPPSGESFSPEATASLINEGYQLWAADITFPLSDQTLNVREFSSALSMIQWDCAMVFQDNARSSEFFSTLISESSRGNFRLKQATQFTNPK